MTAAKPHLDLLPPTMRRRYANLSEDEWQEKLKQCDELLGELFKFPALRELILKASEFAEGKEITTRLVSGSLGLLGGTRSGSSLDPLEVGLFLARLSNCEPDDLSWQVRHGLKRLCIKRRSRRGRPKGRISEIEHFISFRVFERLIEEGQLWKKKGEFKRKFRNSWPTQLRKILQADRWSADEIQLAIKSTSARTLALQMAANCCGVEFDTVQKSVRRVSRRMAQAKT